MYEDSRGVPTIGWGHNLRDKPISNRACDLIFDDDLNDAEQELVTALPWAADLIAPRFAVLIDMTFNMGIGGLLTFHNMLAACHAGDWLTAAAEMQNSDWHKQVGERAVTLERSMLTGQW